MRFVLYKHYYWWSVKYLVRERHRLEFREAPSSEHRKAAFCLVIKVGLIQSLG